MIRQVTAICDGARVVIDELDMCEGKMTCFAVQLSFPLAVHAQLGHFDLVADLQLQGRIVVRVRNSRLDYASQGRKFTLDLRSAILVLQRVDRQR